MTVFGIAVGVKTKFLVTMFVKEDSIHARIIKHVFHSIGNFLHTSDFYYINHGPQRDFD